MAITQEKLNIILMRDSGESRRMRVRRSSFRFIIGFFLLCPFLAGAAITSIYYLWEEKTKLQEQIVQLEEINYNNVATIKRLSHLDSLLDRKKGVQIALAQNMVSNNAAQQNASGKGGKNPPVAAKSGSGNEAKLAENNVGPEDNDGPGHAEFPVLDTKEIIVQNVTSILSSKKRLRTSFDLRNDGKDSISGEVFCILSLASGKTVRLVPRPPDAGKYKIARFKKAVILAQVDADIDMNNAQLILEVKNEKGVEVFRNVYPISQ